MSDYDLKFEGIMPVIVQDFETREVFQNTYSVLPRFFRMELDTVNISVPYPGGKCISIFGFHDGCR